MVYLPQQTNEHSGDALDFDAFHVLKTPTPPPAPAVSRRSGKKREEEGSSLGPVTTTNKRRKLDAKNHPQPQREIRTLTVTAMEAELLQIPDLDLPHNPPASIRSRLSLVPPPSVRLQFRPSQELHWLMERTANGFVRRKGLESCSSSEYSLGR